MTLTFSVDWTSVLVALGLVWSVGSYALNYAGARVLVNGWGSPGKQYRFWGAVLRACTTGGMAFSPVTAPLTWAIIALCATWHVAVKTGDWVLRE